MAAVNAVVTLTFAANAIAAETVTIGGKVYTWAAAYANTDGLVVVGGTAAASAQNLFDAINLTPSALGVTVGAVTTLNAQVRAITVTATTVVFQSKIPGTIGNLIPSTETMTQGSFGTATLISGTGDAAFDLLTILNTMQMSAGVAQALRELAFDPASV